MVGERERGRERERRERKRERERISEIASFVFQVATKSIKCSPLSSLFFF